MKKLASLVILLFCAVTTVSAQQKQRIAVLPSVGDLEPTGLILLTDKVREIATQNLPMENFNILKQDVITKMIGEEELYRACKEGVCIGDLAKRTNADYGLRCDIVKFQNRLVLKFEIYSVNEDAIFETFTDYGVKDFDGMLKVLETRLPKTFQKVITAYNSGKTSQNKTQLSAPAEPAPEPPKIYTLTTAAEPPDGGRISRNPNYSTYYAGSNVTVTAIPYAGYTFAGWSGGITSANDNMRITIDSNLTLTANFRRMSESKPEPPKTYTLTTAASPPYYGRVLRNPDYSTYYAGTDVTVTASPYDGYTFAGWSGGITSANDNMRITIDSNLTLTANFRRVPKPAPPPVAAAPPPKPTPKPEYKPYEPPKRKNKSSFGAGAFFANDAGGGLRWKQSGEQIAMPYTGGGVYTYIDFTSMEFVIGLSGGGGKWKSADVKSGNLPDGMSRTYMNFAAFVKLPFGGENVKFFPLLGLDYEASISAELKGGSGISAPGDGDLSAMWFKLGGGLDIGLGKNTYLRGELLYGWRTANSYENSFYDHGAEPRPGSGVTMKIGIGFKF